MKNADLVNAAHALTKARMSRIEQLTIAVRNGTYHVDPERIAGRMLESSAFIDDLCDDVDLDARDTDERDA